MSGRNCWVFLTILTVNLVRCQCSDTDFDNPLIENEELIKLRASELRRFIFPAPDDEFSDALIMTAERLVPLRAESEVCRNHSKHLMDSLINGQLWALKMIDSATKMKSGVLEGNIQDLGNYQQCISTEEPGGMFRGQHCVANVQGVLPEDIAEKITRTVLPGFDLNVRLAVCVPSSCSQTDVYNHLESYFTTIDASVIHMYKDFNDTDIFDNVFCSTGEGVPFRMKDYVAMSVFCAAITIVIFATFLQSRSELFSQISLSRNWDRLIDTKGSSDEISCINGMRVLLIWIVVFVHRCFEAVLKSNHRYKTIVETYDQAWFISFNHFWTTSAMDIFFLTTSTVLSHNYFLRMWKNGGFNIIHFYIHRYFRLTGLLSFLVLYYATLLVHTSSGPVWKSEVMYEEYRCTNKWWLGLTHTYIAPGPLCTAHSWFLTTEFHLNLLAPIFLVTLYKRPRLGVLLLAFCGTASLAFIMFYGYFDKVTSIDYRWFYDHNWIPLDRFVHTFFVFRVPDYLMGLFLGYILIKIKTEEYHLRLTQGILCAGWLLCAGIIVTHFLVLFYLLKPDFGYHRLFEAFYYAVQKPMSCLSMGWIIFTCALGYGGVINSFLSAPLFRPLTKLALPVYLNHGLVRMKQTYSLQVIPDFNLLDICFYFFGDLGISYLVAIPLHLFIEVPICVTVDYFLKGSKSKGNPASKLKSASTTAKK